MYPSGNREYRFTITEHDPERPWMVLSSEHRTIKLPDGRDFFAWAHDQWPGATLERSARPLAAHAEVTALRRSEGCF
jgi:hypothetical protein